MLTIKVPLTDESFDDDKQEFIERQTVDVVLEHSLSSLSKWESRFEKPFLSDAERSDEETLGYIECMTISEDFSPEMLARLTNDNIEAINKYINSKMTATVINKLPSVNKPGRKETITSELLYYWMIKMAIPFECQFWHLNRLMMLIEVYEAKEAPVQKVSAKDAAAQRRAMNEQRRAENKTRG